MTLAGIVTCATWLCEKAASSILRSPSLRIRFETFEKKNAELPIVSTLPGISTVVIFERLKAFAAIDFTVPGIVTEVSLELQKAYSPIVSTPSAKLSDFLAAGQ